MSSSRALLWMMFLGLAGAVVLIARYLLPAEEVVPAVSRRGAPVAAAQGIPNPPPPSLELPDRLERRAPETDSSTRDVFEAKSWAAAPPPPPAAAAPPAPVVAPPLPFRFIGWIDDGDRLRPFLSRGDEVFEVAEGDALDPGYRVERIEPTRITFLYAPLSQTQTLSLGGGSAQAAAPATGPEHGASASAAPADGPSAAAVPETATGLSPDQLDRASVAIRIRQQQMRDRARERATRR